MYSRSVKLAEVQQKTLGIAEQLIRFCQNNHLLVYLCGGGAIGAIREHGFIPWDDDLDFFMPRSDYEKLHKKWSEQVDPRYKLEKPMEGFVNHNNFTTIRDSQTTFIKTYQKDLDLTHGIAIDVFPLDVSPTLGVLQHIQKGWAMFYALFSEQLVPRTHGGLINLGSRLLLNLFEGQKIRYSIWSYSERQMTKYNSQQTGYVTELCVGPKYMGNRYHDEDFASAIYLEFEDIKLPVPVGYHRYLSQVFGDYMNRPTIDKQRPHHDAVYIDPDRSYKKYKGIYYLNKGDN